MATTTTGERRTGPRQRGDQVFRGLATGSGLLILAVLAGVTLFLTIKGVPAFTAAPEDVGDGDGIVAYIWPLLFGTFWGAVLALVTAVPVSVGVALFISHYAPRRFAQTLGYVIDLLAAVPSVVYGLWGIFFLAPQLVPMFAWLDTHLGFIPLFAGPASVTGRCFLTVALVLAVMILPIITALCREIFLQTPRLHEEAALALGATRWEMIRMTVLPHARSGIVSASMLGMGRALGETMAVVMVLSTSGAVTVNLISNTNPTTIAANIALQFPEAFGLEVNVLVATGLALFVLTFLVNLAARAIVARSREFTETT